MFNLKDVAIPQGLNAATMGTKKTSEKFAARKSHNQEFVTVNSSSEYTASVYCFKRKEDGEVYLVNPSVVSTLPGCYPAQLFLAANRQGAVFVWPATLPSQDGRTHGAHTSALENIERAKVGWVKNVWNRDAAAYEAEEPVAKFPSPQWPEKDFESIVQIAFKDRYIDSVNHIIVKQILGEV
jgi:hypothetical protein